MLKDAISGEVTSMEEPQVMSGQEETIQCLVCNFIGNEMRFIKQAEREPRMPITPNLS